MWSLPSWERGLKLQGTQASDAYDLSLPSWERGLKSQKGINIFAYRGRSPRGSVD